MKKRYWNMFFNQHIGEYVPLQVAVTLLTQKAGVKQMQCRTNRKMQCT